MNVSSIVDTVIIYIEVDALIILFHHFRVSLSWRVENTTWDRVFPAYQRHGRVSSFMRPRLLSSGPTNSLLVRHHVVHREPLNNATVVLKSFRLTFWWKRALARDDTVALSSLLPPRYSREHLPTITKRTGDKRASLKGKFLADDISTSSSLPIVFSNTHHFSASDLFHP